MGTEVLRPQDLLTEPIRFNTRRKPYYSGHNNNKSGKKPFIRSEPKKNPAESFTKTGFGFVLGDVKILKRGETIELKKTTNHLKISNSDFRSEEIYAGSVFSSSPSPRKVPLPSFSKKINGGLMMKTKVSDEFAAQDLRKLLRID